MYSEESKWKLYVNGFQNPHIVFYKKARDKSSAHFPPKYQDIRRVLIDFEVSLESCHIKVI